MKTSDKEFTLQVNPGFIQRIEAEKKFKGRTFLEATLGLKKLVIRNEKDLLNDVDITKNKDTLDSISKLELGSTVKINLDSSKYPTMDNNRYEKGYATHSAGSIDNPYPNDYSFTETVTEAALLGTEITYY